MHGNSWWSKRGAVVLVLAGLTLAACSGGSTAAPSSSSAPAATAASMAAPRISAHLPRIRHDDTIDLLVGDLNLASCRVHLYPR